MSKKFFPWCVATLKKFGNWFGKVISRLSRIVLELLSVKMIVALIVTYVYMEGKQNLGILGFTLDVILWCFVIGFRYAEKLMYLAHPSISTSSKE